MRKPSESPRVHRSFRHHDGEVSDPPKNIDADVVAVSDEVEIHGRSGDLEVRDPEFRQQGGQPRLMEPDPPLDPAYAQTQARLQQQEDRARGPGLRAHATGYGTGPSFGSRSNPQNNSGIRFRSK